MLLQAQAVSPWLSVCSDRAGCGWRSVPARLCNLKMREKMRRGGTVCLTSDGGGDSGYGAVKKRKVVEHICLFKAKKSLSDEEEKNMLDYLYTSQYQMPGILSISVGSILEQNLEGYTHALYVRFHKKEDITKFYENPFQLKVLSEHVTPYCHGLINLDFESEVEDDIIPLFRKGEEFNYGVEFLLLIAFLESASGDQAEDAMNSFASMILEFPSLVVQSTQGRNFNVSSMEYTEVIMIRFRSIEAFELFFGASEYKDLWKSKFEPITQNTLAIHYAIDPVGTDVL